MALILIVEDDSRMAREIGAALADHGLRSEHAATGVDAIQKARATTYDAIILDGMLPGGAGGSRSIRRAARHRQYHSRHGP